MARRPPRRPWHPPHLRAPSTAAARTKVDNRIDKALARVDKVSADLAKDTNVSAGDRASLSAKLATIRQQLTTAKAAADAAPDVATLKGDVKSVLSTLKQAGDVAQVRAIVAKPLVDEQGDQRRDRPDPQHRGARLSAAQSKGVNVAAAQAALTDLQAKVAAAHTQVSGLAESVLSGATSPADAKTALVAARSDLTAARTDIKTHPRAAARLIKAVSRLQRSGETVVRWVRLVRPTGRRARCRAAAREV